MRRKTTELLTAILIICALTGCADNTEPSYSNPVSAETVENITGEPESSSVIVIETKQEYTNENIACSPIDQDLDCEAILLEKAEALSRLMTDYLSMDESKLVYDIGEPFNEEYYASKVYSDELACYADFKALFADSVYGGYFDYINTITPRMLDIDGELYRCDHEGGYLGTLETWYIGCDVYDDRIIGHFAELRGIGEPEEATAEYLNDESSYWFYDITVQNVGGDYVITDCRETTSGRAYDYFQIHGWSYNSGFADRSLITNEKVMPKVSPM